MDWFLVVGIVAAVIYLIVGVVYVLINVSAIQQKREVLQGGGVVTKAVLMSVIFGIVWPLAILMTLVRIAAKKSS